MCSSHRLLILLLCAAFGGAASLKDITVGGETKGIDFYKNILLVMQQQKRYEGLLIAHRSKIQDPRVAAIYMLPIAKIIMANHGSFYYKSLFDSDIVAIVVMENQFHHNLWQDFTKTLFFLRQIRILMIFINPFSVENTQRTLLIEYEKSKTTNIISHFLNTSNLEEPSSEYFLLDPYPYYHFQLQRFDNSNEFFLPRKLNMRGKTIITLLDQSVPRSFMYRNRNGELKSTGFVFKLFECFTQVYNATYKFLYQPNLNEVIHPSILVNMTKYGVLDMPACVAPLQVGKNILYVSFPVEFAKWTVMVPCAKHLKTKEVYKVLFAVDLIAIFILFSTLFCFIHTVIEKLFYRKMIWLNLVMSDKVIPGLLGQSFILKKTKLISLRSIYILIFVMGLCMSTTISAHLQTLLTSPPLGRQINTFEDLIGSGLKLLFDRSDLEYLEGDDDIFDNGVERVIEYTNDTTMFNKYRVKFNASYAYTVTSALWNVFSFVQNAYAQKHFCTNDVGLNIKDTFLLGIPLELNSPYKTPLNDLINRIHDSGLLEIWQLQVIGDLLKLKKISFRDSNKMKTYEDLSEGDLLYVWMVLSLGLVSSLLMFFIEILFYNFVNYIRKLNAQKI